MKFKKSQQGYSDITYGPNGIFEVDYKGSNLFVIASEGLGWEHVSVHSRRAGRDFTPTWEEMCHLKDLFWDVEDCVLQFHPPHSEYVNVHKHTLHLWRQQGINHPTPAKIMV